MVFGQAGGLPPVSSNTIAIPAALDVVTVHDALRAVLVVCTSYAVLKLVETPAE